MRLFSLILCFVLLSRIYLPARDFVNDSLTLDDIDKFPNISYSLISLGGHQENCVSFSLTNKTNDTIRVYIEPGRILFAENADFQDLVVMRSLYFMVPQGKEVKKSIYAFCCRAKRSSPAKGLAFRNGYFDLGFMGKLGSFVNKGTYNPDDIQSSVWAISDNYPIASICENNGSHSNLKKWLADQLNKPYPWHCIVYDQRDTSVLRNRHLRVTGNISFRVSNYSLVTIQIRNKEGRVIDYIQKNVACTAGEYDLPLSLDVQNWPKGIYEIMVFSDGNRIHKPVFFDL